MMLRPSRPATDLILNASDILIERSRAESPDWSATRRAWTRGEPTVQSIPMARKALAAARLRSPMVSCPLRIRVTRVEGMGTRTTGRFTGAAKHTDDARKWPRMCKRPNWPSSLNCASTALSGPSWIPAAIGSINDGWRRICGVGRGQATRGCGVSIPAHEAHSVIAGRPHPAQEAPMIRSAAATRNGSTTSDCPLSALTASSWTQPVDTQSNKRLSPTRPLKGLRTRRERLRRWDRGAPMRHRVGAARCVRSCR